VVRFRVDLPASVLVRSIGFSLKVGDEGGAEPLDAVVGCGGEVAVVECEAVGRMWPPSRFSASGLAGQSRVKHVTDRRPPERSLMDA